MSYSTSPTFNLWSESWISVEQPSGDIHTVSITEILTDAHLIRAIYDPSPLVVVGIHRLLVAILQTIYSPKNPLHLLEIWRDEKFIPEKINDFGAQYVDRFDLFSEDAPFYQTSDISLELDKENKSKPVGYLFQEQPAGTAVTHYNHNYDVNLCSHCVAKGLLVMPAFASSGGAGIKPSINGVPPIYVLPGGETLFQSLVASLTTPAYHPPKFESNMNVDKGAWWQRSSPIVVEKSKEVRGVSYLYSLTFPARRIRLHPTTLDEPCSRCGEQPKWGVQKMVYQMGESRSKTASFWRDPFAAYQIPKSEGVDPLPIRPVAGRASWLEFRGLFLPHKEDDNGLKARRPSVISQIEEVWQNDKKILPYKKIPLRVIALRTDMKAKIFEWEEAGYQIPPHLLNNLAIADDIQKGIDFAKHTDNDMKRTFHHYFGGGGKKSSRYKTLKNQMSKNYWQRLGHKFSTHLLDYTPNADEKSLFHDWLDMTIQETLSIFEETVNSLPNDGITLHKRQEAINDCRKKLFTYRKKNYPRPKDASE